MTGTDFTLQEVKGSLPWFNIGGALDGIRVVEMGDAMGEWLGKLLADLGATVIKVEPLDGAETRRVGPFVDDVPDPERSLFFWHYNTSKHSLRLDTTSEEGRALLHRLIQSADVLIETFRAGEALAAGLDYETLRRLNPKLIQVSITPFGQMGPYAHYKATDLILLAMGGPMQSCGYDAADNLPPVRPGPYHSFHTACHYACTAVLAALWERDTSGEGQYIDVSAQACLATTTEGANLQWEYLRAIVVRQTGRHAAATPTANSQQICSDGKPINFMMIRDERVIQSLLSYLTDEGLTEGVDLDLFTNPERQAERAGAAINLLEVITSQRPAEDVMQVGQAMGFTWGAVRAPEEWLDDPHGLARGMTVQVEHPELGRSVTYPGAPMQFSNTPWRIRRRAPLLGEDNTQVLQDLGLTSEEITSLSQRSIV